MEEEVMTSTEICHLLKVGPQTLYKLCANEGLPHFRIGKSGGKRFHYRFLKAEVLGWMAQRQQHLPKEQES